MMQSPAARPSILMLTMTTLELIFHQAVRGVRKSHGNAVVGLMLNIAQTMILVAVFMLIYVFSGLRGGGVRGDTLI